MLALPRTARSTIEVSFVSFGLISMMRAPLALAIQSRPLAGRTVADVPMATMQSAMPVCLLAAPIVSSGTGSPNITVSYLTGPPHAPHGAGGPSSTNPPSRLLAPHVVHLSRLRFPWILYEVGDAGAFVEAVDVLRDYALQRAVPDHPGERPVTFVRFRGGQRAPQFQDVRVDLAVHLPMPIALRVRLKPAVAVHGRSPVAGPQAACAPEWGDTAFHRHTGAGHRHDM